MAKVGMYVDQKTREQLRTPGYYDEIYSADGNERLDHKLEQIDSDLTNLPKSVPFSGTTDANGECVTSIKYVNGMVAVANKGVSHYFAIRQSSSGNVVLRATAFDGLAVKNGAISGTINYIKHE